MDTIQQFDLSSTEGPKYRALARQISDMVAGGALRAGDKMPPVRDLAWQLKVTPGTVARAYQLLTDQGQLVAQVGRGTFVSGAPAPQPVPMPAAPRPGVLDMRTPVLPEMGQVALIRRALKEAASRDAAVLMDYPDPALSDPTRRAVLDSIDSFDTANLSPDHVVLSHGGQHAFSLILMAVLRGPAPAIMTEELAYHGFRHAARLARAEIVPIAQDAEGPLPDAIEAACAAHDIQVLTTSAHAHNPTTITTSPARRREIAALARAHDFQIVDDQCYSLVHDDRPSYRDLAPERVWFISSVSKAISPALRIGWFIAPEGKAALGQLVAEHSFFGLSQPMSDVAHILKGSADSQALRDKVRAEIARRVDMLRAALDGYDLRARSDVPFAFLNLPRGWRASSFQRACEHEGLLIRAADEYMLADGRAPNAIRIAINGQISMSAFQNACQTLRRLLDAPPHEIGV